MKRISLPSTLQTIPEQCFDGCDSLEIIIVPKSVINVGEHDFHLWPILLFEGTKHYSSIESNWNSKVCYGFERFEENDTFKYALCRDGTIKECYIIALVDGATKPSELPTEIEEYLVVYCFVEL